MLSVEKRDFYPDSLEPPIVVSMKAAWLFFFSFKLVASLIDPKFSIQSFLAPPIKSTSAALL